MSVFKGVKILTFQVILNAKSKHKGLKHNTENKRLSVPAAD
jgi:hypothetical protein